MLERFYGFAYPLDESFVCEKGLDDLEMMHWTKSAP